MNDRREVDTKGCRYSEVSHLSICGFEGMYRFKGTVG